MKSGIRFGLLVAAFCLMGLLIEASARSEIRRLFVQCRAPAHRSEFQMQELRDACRETESRMETLQQDAMECRESWRVAQAELVVIRQRLDQLETSKRRRWW